MKSPIEPDVDTIHGALKPPPHTQTSVNSTHAAEQTFIDASLDHKSIVQILSANPSLFFITLSVNLTHLIAIIFGFSFLSVYNTPRSSRKKDRQRRVWRVASEIVGRIRRLRRCPLCASPILRHLNIFTRSNLFFQFYIINK